MLTTLNGSQQNLNEKSNTDLSLEFDLNLKESENFDVI
jgi:hypothetical protein